MVEIIRVAAALGHILFAPAALATFLSGFAMAWFWLGFDQLWVIVGLAGFAYLAGSGTLVLKPCADRMIEEISANGMTPAALAEGRRMTMVGVVDYGVMFLILADMIMKPTAHDLLGLAVLAACPLIALAIVSGLRSEPVSVAA